MNGKTFVICALLVLSVALGKVAAAGGGKRSDSVAASNVYFGEGAYIVHKVKEGSSGISSDICDSRPDGTLIFVDNAVGAARDPTPVLCNDGAAFPLGPNARPNFGFARDECPSGYRRANVWEAALWMRSNGHLLESEGGVETKAQVDLIGTGCDFECAQEDLSYDSLLLIANANEGSGKVFWDDASPGGEADDILCISKLSPIQFAPPVFDGSAACTGNTAGNQHDSTDAEKDTYCQAAFGDSYRAASLSTLLENVHGAFSEYFINNFLASRVDVQGEGDPVESPSAFFTAAAGIASVDTNLHVFAFPVEEEVAFERTYNGFPTTAFDSACCQAPVFAGLNLLKTSDIDCSGCPTSNCEPFDNLYVAC